MVFFGGDGEGSLIRPTWGCMYARACYAASHMKNLISAGLLLLPLLGVACAGSDAGSDLTQDEAALTRGPASLVVPLIDEDQKLLSRFNAKATAQGLKALPDTVELKNVADADRYNELRDYYNDEVMDAVGAPVQAMPAWGPGSFTMSGPPGLCYKGNPLKVVEFLGEMAGRAFSEQLIVHGWRYKQLKKFDADVDPNEPGVDEGFPEVWHEWRGTGEAILVVSSTNDGGDEFSPSIIPRCR
jgi:hypothetical protein